MSGWSAFLSELNDKARLVEFTAAHHQGVYQESARGYFHSGPVILVLCDDEEISLINVAGNILEGAVIIGTYCSLPPASHYFKII